MTGSGLPFLLGRLFRFFPLSHFGNDFLFLRQIVAEPSHFVSCIRQFFSNPLQVVFVIPPRFDQPIAAFNMVVVPADGLVRDLADSDGVNK